MLIDTHAHLNFAAFNKDREQVIKKCLDNNFWVINVGTNLKTSKEVIDLAGKYQKVIYASVGLHPMALDTGLLKIKSDEFDKDSFEEKFDYEAYRQLAQNKKVVAIGEIGLDYYWKPKTTGKKELFKQMQKDLLRQQLKLAKELNLPVIFHCRVAHRDLLNFMKENTGLMPKRYVAHGFVGNLEELKEYLNLGFRIGINGIIFKKIQGINFVENIRNIPLEKILIETDCPYLAPPNVNGERNEPIFVKYVVEEISRIKKDSSEKISQITAQNAREFFGI